MKNPLRELENFGQSVWLDYIQRSLITSGGLKKLIEDDGLGGMTSNPSIFEQAIAHSDEYDSDIYSMLDAGKDINTIYDVLTQHDVRAAADVFRNLYNKLDAKDGYVSLEVNPHLAHDTQGSIAEARRLWKALDRPNVLIKVPATKAGIPAIQQLISEGININVTLLFGLQNYRAVAEAYIAGLEALSAKGAAINHVASVASFFLSRIDTMVDPQLEQLHNTSLQGEAAIASAKMAYQIYSELFNSDKFKKLQAKGARAQRLLWASTSTKNPKYSDVKYVEALIGPDTVNTLPVETFNAFRDHGKASALLKIDIEHAAAVFKQLAAVGVDMNKVTQQLEDEAVDKFNKSFDLLITALHEKAKKKG